MPSPYPRPVSRSVPRTRPTSKATARRILAVTSLGLAGLLAGLLAGCAASSGAGISAAPVSYAQLAGNWQFSSSTSAAARLSSLGGSLAVNGSAVTGVLHPLSASGQCLSASTMLPVTGSINSTGHLTLTSPLSGGTLTLAGDVSPDRQTLLSATYTVSGGACAFPATTPTVSARDLASATATAQQYQPLTGTFTGTLTDDDGAHFTLSTTITETSQPDTDGIYHLQGSASSPGNACIPPTVNATASLVTGSAVLVTYSDPATGTTIDATGTSSPDGKTISISSWRLTSNCGSDSGTGTLTKP